ncbi:hypothetical protein [Nostoc sp.]|uniref:hypothetical protein n=1 Tax=Nostoc sp. TaxID=1180 RepID=UPI002FF868EF
MCAYLCPFLSLLSGKLDLGPALRRAKPLVVIELQPEEEPILVSNGQLFYLLLK